MPCPTCSETMHNLGVINQRIFWCPRCGTVKNDPLGGLENITVPSLVGRVREFQERNNMGRGFLAGDRNLWHLLGIEESIWPEEGKK